MELSMRNRQEASSGWFKTLEFLFLEKRRNIYHEE